MFFFLIVSISISLVLPHPLLSHFLNSWFLQKEVSVFFLPDLWLLSTVWISMEFVYDLSPVGMTNQNQMMTPVWLDPKLYIHSHWEALCFFGLGWKIWNHSHTYDSNFYSTLLSAEFRYHGICFSGGKEGKLSTYITLDNPYLLSFSSFQCLERHRIFW